jgi:hypothetical protein
MPLLVLGLVLWPRVVSCLPIFGASVHAPWPPEIRKLCLIFEKSLPRFGDFIGCDPFQTKPFKLNVHYVWCFNLPILASPIPINPSFLDKPSNIAKYHHWLPTPSPWYANFYGWTLPFKTLHCRVNQGSLRTAPSLSLTLAPTRRGTMDRRGAPEVWVGAVVHPSNSSIYYNP